MGLPEKDYIAKCKQLIEEKFHFETDNGTIRQRDLDYLSDQIEAISGIRLSLSTLKRLWKKDYDQVPHPSTLQALVSVLGYKDWQAFKSKESDQPEESAVSGEKKKPAHIYLWISLAVIIILILSVSLITLRSGKPGASRPVMNGPVTFTGNKTLATGTPNTIVFNYDVSNVIADSFSFQQSWDEKERVLIDPQKHYYSAIYYYPGFHRAKLIANDSILKRFKVHILTDGWMPLIRSRNPDPAILPVYLQKDQYIKDGQLHINPQGLANSRINDQKDFVLSYYNIREFSGINSDNFSIDTRVMLYNANEMTCPTAELVIICEENIFFVNLIRKGCERNSSLRIGEVYEDGVQHDLSGFGRDLEKWQRLQVQVVNKKATILIEGQPVRTISFKQDFGKVMGLAYHFTGMGAIDYVRLHNSGGQLVYDEEFTDR